MSKRALLFVLILSACAIARVHAEGAEEAGTSATLVLDGGDLGGAAPQPAQGAGDTPDVIGEGVQLACLSPWVAADAAAPTISDRIASLATPELVAQSAPTPRPMAIEYSDGYHTRMKIHKYASFATLPLFVSQYFVGQKLYDGTGSDGTRSAHKALVAGTAALFAVNTVTGIWNQREARKDPHGRNRRRLHGLLMAVADAGFVATGMMAPEGAEHEGGFEHEGGGTSKSTHRAVALSSMGVATVSYLIMLFGH
jgi:hypothetical protein